MIELHERTFDRVEHHDPRSDSYPSSDLITVAALRSIQWALSIRLDQGREGSCIGHGFGHDLAAAPVRVRAIDHEYAVGLYEEAQRLDDRPGQDYSGTTVLAGAKACQRRGFYSAYHWAQTIDDVVQALSAIGPVIVGAPWLDGMVPDPSGLIRPEGRPLGGHCWIVRGLTLRPRLKGHSKLGPVVRCTNSWGRSFGVNGDFYLEANALDALLSRGGDACVPVRTKKVAAVG